MKKNKTVWIVIVCIVVVCLALFAWWKSAYMIDVSQVENISFGNSPASEAFSEEDTAKFILLFNLARYKGKDIGYGTTPELEMSVYFHDGRCLSVSEYGDHNFFVVYRADGKSQSSQGYFIESKMLDDFVWKLAAEMAE